MKYIITIAIVLLSFQVSFSQKQKKGYIKYELELTKEPTEMASMEKIEAKFGHTLEMAWNKGWALQRKNIQGRVDLYFLSEEGEQNQNIYVHFLENDKKVAFPIEEGYKKDFEFYKLLAKYEWVKTKQTRVIEGLKCRVYQLKVEAYPHNVNDWCISEKNNGFFTYYPFYEGQDLGLPLSMDVGSSIVQKLRIVENSKKISDQLKTFKKEDFTMMEHAAFKKKHVSLYHTIFAAI